MAECGMFDGMGGQPCACPNKLPVATFRWDEGLPCPWCGNLLIDPPYKEPQKPRQLPDEGSA